MGYASPMKRMLLFLLTGLLLCNLAPAHTPTPRQEVLRLHILSNSDSPEDQAVKLLVRDALLPLFTTAPTYADARAFVLENGKAILTLCEQTLLAAGAGYGVQLLLGVCPFPDRTYDGVAFPAGDYDALRIILGQGQGHNWWCVLFPPLCIVTPDGDPLPPDEPLRFESTLLSFLKRRLGRG